MHCYCAKPMKLNLQTINIFHTLYKSKIKSTMAETKQIKYKFFSNLFDIVLLNTVRTLKKQHKTNILTYEFHRPRNPVFR